MMKTSLQIALLGLAAMAVAQFGALPDCAKGCATSSLPANCNLGVQCICSDSSFISGISCCVKSACSPSDQQKTLMVAQQLCSTVGVTLPSVASCPGGASAGPSGASSAASGASMGASSAASMASSMASSAVSSASSVASVVSSSAAAGASSKSSTAAAGASSASSVVGAGTPSSSSTTPSSTGGAVKDIGSKLGAVGAAVAALYLI